MARLITLLSSSCFPLLSQTSSIIYAPVSDCSSCLVGACGSPLYRRYHCFLSDLPGLYPNESLSSGRLTHIPDEQLWDWDVHHRLEELQPEVTCGYVVTVPFCCSVVTGYHKGQPYVSDPKVKSFIHWTKTLKDNAVLEKTAVGGHYYYPHPPQKCLQEMADSSGEGKKTSTLSVSSWANFFPLYLTCVLSSSAVLSI